MLQLEVVASSSIRYFEAVAEASRAASLAFRLSLPLKQKKSFHYTIAKFQRDDHATVHKIQVRHLLKTLFIQASESRLLCTQDFPA